MGASMQQRAPEIVLSVIQAGALERMALRVESALGASVRARAVQRNVEPALYMDQDQIEFVILIDEAERCACPTQLGTRERSTVTFSASNEMLAGGSARVVQHAGGKLVTARAPRRNCRRCISEAADLFSFTGLS